MDGIRHVPFDESCNRHENGIQTINNPGLNPGANAGFSIVAMSCIEQFKTGYFRFVTGIRRRLLLADEDYGLVFSVALLDHAGNISSVTLTDGRTMPVNVTSPFSFLGGGMVKIKNGLIHRIHTVLIRAPYKMNSGWE